MHRIVNVRFASKSRHYDCQLRKNRLSVFAGIVSQIVSEISIDETKLAF